ncbi:MAG: ferredoxin [Elusimicrobia bacterium]|nr:ferredoxin [Elusimicrobiota bacterium]
MKVKIDEESCIGCELCMRTIPEIFSVKNEVAVVLAQQIPSHLRKGVTDAAGSCPADAILIIDDHS